MAITTQTVKVDLNTGTILPTIYAHQNDDNRQARILVFNNGVPFSLTGCTVTFSYKSAQRNGEYTVITNSSEGVSVSGNEVTLSIPKEYTLVSGFCLLTMKIENSQNTIRPVNITLAVQRSADGDDVISGASDFGNLFEEYFSDDIANVVGEWLSNHPEITTTIQDGEVGISKLTSSLQNTIIANGTGSTKNPDSYGAVGDGTSDDTEAIQACFSACSDGDMVRFTNGKTYLITSPVYVPQECSIDFNWATIICATSLDDDFAIYYGYDTNGTRVGKNKYRTTVRNFMCKTEDDVYHEGLGFLKVGRETNIKFFASRFVDRVIEFARQYIDFGYIGYGYISGRKNSDYFAIDTGKLGDLRELDHLQEGAWTISQDGETHNFIKIGIDHFNVYAHHIIGSIESYSPTLYENIMLSYWGYIHQHGHSCTINHVHGSLGKNNYNRIRVERYVRDGNYPEYYPDVDLSDIVFAHTQIDDQIANTEPIYIDTFLSFTARNVYVAQYRVANQNTLGKSYAYIKFAPAMEEFETLYNRFACQYNGKTVTRAAYKLDFSITAPEQVGISSLSANVGIDWGEESGTYYYRCQRVTDEQYSLCATAGTEKSISLTNGGLSPAWTFSGIEGRYLLLRGTASGVYDHYMFINVPANQRIIDNGFAVNGTPWEEGTMTTLPKYVFDYIHYRGDRKDLVRNGLPTSFENLDDATFKNGDTFVDTKNNVFYVYFNSKWNAVTTV